MMDRRAGERRLFSSLVVVERRTKIDRRSGFDRRIGMARRIRSRRTVGEDAD